MSANPIEAGEQHFLELAEDVIGRLGPFLEQLAEGDAQHPDPLGPDLVESLQLDERPSGRSVVLDLVERAARYGFETAGPRYFGYIPAGGLPSSAVASLLTQVFNRYATVADMAPGMVAIEESVLSWLCREFCLPAGSGGLLTTGGSNATLTAMVAARDAVMGDDHGNGVIYVSRHTHLCVAKSAHVAGISTDRVRQVPVDDRLKMIPGDLNAQIERDLDAGFRPLMVVGTGGTTDSGTIDPLDELATTARRHNAWFHVDAAYGGAFQLTESGRERLRGIEEADSITLDPHKGLFMPYGIGALLVKDTSTLSAAHHVSGPYLQDLEGMNWLPDYSERGNELTREHRGLRMWLPLRLHGVAAFREVLDERLRLAQHVYETLRAEHWLDVPWKPDLSTVVFACRAGDESTKEMFQKIRNDRRFLLTSTAIDGRFYIRVCILSFRTGRTHVNDLLQNIVRLGPDRGH